MVSDVEPMVFPSRDVAGEFVGKIFVTGMLPKLNAGTPYNGWIFGGRLRFYTEEMAEKIPMGFNSKKSFTIVDENSNMADRVRVVLSIKTHRRVTTGNTRSREAPGTAGEPRSLGQWPSDLAHTLAWSR
jgi:hypothetical protein